MNEYEAAMNCGGRDEAFAPDQVGATNGVEPDAVSTSGVGADADGAADDRLGVDGGRGEVVGVPSAEGAPGDETGEQALGVGGDGAGSAEEDAHDTVVDGLAADGEREEGGFVVGDIGAVTGASVEDESAQSPGEEVSSAERDEGDIAADFIEELLDIADIDGDLEIEVTGGRTYVAVSAEGSSSLGRISSPEVVDALQQVTRLAVQAETGEFSRLILDIGGSREARRRELEALVARAIERIEGGATSAALPPMSSYERKLVHDIAAERGFSSESEGEGRKRHTVLRAL